MSWDLTQHHAVRKGIVVSLRSLLTEQDNRCVDLRSLDVIARSRATLLLAISIVCHSLQTLKLLVTDLLIVILLKDARHIAEPLKNRKESGIRNLIEVGRWS